MAQSIPAARLVRVTPGVVSAGGSSLDFNGLIVTDDARLPMTAVYSFGAPDTVADFFGPESTEAEMASVYFNGFNNSTVKPGELLFARYATTAAAGWVRGIPVTLDELKAITSGTLSVTVDGTLKTSSAINLSAATSPSNAASLIQAAFTSPGFTVTFDTLSQSLQITSSTTGPASTIAITTGSVATALKITAALGATTSPGAAASVPATFMTAVTAQTQNFVSFSTTFEPSTDDAYAIALWNSQQTDRYIYAAWDTDVANTTQSPTTTLKARIEAADLGGTIVIYTTALNYLVGAFVLGFFASLSFTETNGRATLAYKGQEGLTPDVVDGAVYDRLIANGLNFYGRYSTANDNFNLFQPGSISGKFLWADSFGNQVWLNNQFQLALIGLLSSLKSIPYNTAGYGLIAAALQDPINAGLNFGAIRTGVTLSAQQRAAVDNAAGVEIAETLQNEGYYLQIQDADPQTRVERGSPPIRFWYTDGQSVQKIDMNSLEVQ